MTTPENQVQKVFQVLISTMNQKDHSLLDRMNVVSDAIVINQCDKYREVVFDYNGHEILWIDVNERGISKSRNLALSKAEAEICYIADDDIIFDSHIERSIVETYRSNPEYDMIVFQVKNIKRTYKPKSHRIWYMNSMKRSSVEISFKTHSIRSSGISFNEMFGAGSHFIMGEENLFLFDCLKRKLNICFVPQFVSELRRDSVSTWFKGYDKKYFESKGAQFAAMSRSLALLLSIQFAIRKHHLYRQEISVFNALKWMFDGRKEYLSILRGNS